MAKLSGQRLRELARPGAEAELSRLRAEVAALEAAFPELKGSGRRAKVAVALTCWAFFGPAEA